MKRTLLSAIAMALLFSGLQAQTEYKTYDASDANLDTKVNVGDAVHVANHAMDEKPDRNIVTATNAYDVLVNLNSYFETVGYTTEAIHALDARLSALESSLGIPTPSPHEYVDLGVMVEGHPVYWSTMNIGAESPADYGLQFAWGEIQGFSQLDNDQHEFTWFNYTTHSEGDERKMTKYCLSSTYGQVDGKSELEPNDDVAHVTWKGAWRMPTVNDFNALCKQCKWEISHMLDSKRHLVPVYIVSNPNDPSRFIVLPMKEYELLEETNAEGDYWTSTLYETMSNQAYSLVIAKDDRGYYTWPDYRYFGMVIRPVRNL